MSLTKPPIGIEIECPFRFYYPDLYERYFKSGKKFHEYTSYELIGLRESLDTREPAIHRRLEEASKKYSLKRGQDRYWEFVFPPETDYQRHADIIDCLVQDELLPQNIPLSVHFTISGIDQETAYSVALFMEITYATKDRILEGFSNEYFMPAWGKKLCKTGVLKKDASKLIGANVAYEIRIPKFVMKDMRGAFVYLESLLSDPSIVEKAKVKVSDMGLEWKAWGKEDFIKFAEYVDSQKITPQ